MAFVAGDATAWALAQPARARPGRRQPAPTRDRRADLARWLEAGEASYVVYSSCNAESLARDLELMPSLRPVEARVLDMFPQTTHYEVIVLLTR